MVATASINRLQASKLSREASIRSKLSPLKIPAPLNSLSRQDPPSPPGCPPPSPRQRVQQESLAEVDEIEELYAQMSCSPDFDFPVYSPYAGFSPEYPDIPREEGSKDTELGRMRVGARERTGLVRQ